MKKLAIALLTLAAIALPQGAIAQLRYNVPNTPGQEDVVVIFEGSPGSPFSANIWTITTTTKVANPCGLIILSTLDHPLQFDQTGNSVTNQISYASLPIQTLPVCSGGVLSEPRTANFKTPDGKTVLVGQSGAVTVQYLLRRKRSGSFNACGFKTSTIKNTFNVGSDSIGIDFNNQSQSLGDLNSLESLPICRKVGNSYVKYIRLTP